jgi:glycosyltransferase involved in cell wall biosynthesis
VRAARISVVMPSFNHAAFIGDALNSILAQDYDDVECIVVDGGSTDGTLDVLRGYGDKVRWLSEPDDGIYDAVNKGWRTASGDWLGWLNCDDRYAPRALTRLMTAASSAPDCRFVYGDFFRFDSTGRVLETMHSGKPDADVLLRKGNSIFTGASLVRADLARELGYFDQRYSLSADYSFLVRAVLHGQPVYLAEPVAMFRCHADSKSRSSRRLMWREALDISHELSGRHYAGLRVRVVGDEVLHALFSDETLISPAFIGVRRRLRRVWPAR